MFDILINVAALVFVLGVMIFVHEAGHFSAAKFFGIKVNVFALGFGPRLFGVRHGGTDYRVCALPLGGYVSMKGENPDDEITGAPDEYLSRPKWQRLIVLTMGPAMNVVLALLLYTIVYVVGVQATAYAQGPARIGGVNPDSPAAEAGLEAGDRVVAIDGEPIESWREMQLAIMVAAGQELRLTVRRDSRTVPLTVVPDAVTRNEIGVIGVAPDLPTTIDRVAEDSPAAEAGLRPGDRIVAVEGEPVDSYFELARRVEEASRAEDGDAATPAVPDEPGAASVDAPEGTAQGRKPGRPTRLTVVRDGQRLELTVRPELPTNGGQGAYLGIAPEGMFEIHRYGPLVAVGEAVAEARRQTLLVGEILGRILTGRMSAKTLSGPIEIARLSGTAASTGDPTVLLQFMALVSLQLGLLNLLPIPVLDGGHIAILAFEGLTRRDLSLRVKERILQVGFLLLVTLMLVVISFDIIKNVPIGWIEYLPFF